MASLSEALAQVLAVMDRLEIPYIIGGSVASSAHGIPRTTMDVDLVADLQPENIVGFVELLRGEFYVDAEAVRQAIQRQRSFNLIHTGKLLDYAYLREWAPFLKVADLLEELLAEEKR